MKPQETASSLSATSQADRDKGTSPQHRLQDPHSQQEFAGLGACLFQTCHIGPTGCQCSQ